MTHVNQIFKCPKCHGEYPIDEPKEWNDYTGLESAIHECGPNFTAVVMRPKTDEKRQIWDHIFEKLEQIDCPREYLITGGEEE